MTPKMLSILKKKIRYLDGFNEWYGERLTTVEFIYIVMLNQNDEKCKRYLCHAQYVKDNYIKFGRVEGYHTVYFKNEPKYK